MVNNNKVIDLHIDYAHLLATSDNMNKAVEHFFTVRMLLKTSTVDEKSSALMLSQNTQYYKKEALNYQEHFNKNNINVDDCDIIQIIGDSLQLPRPEETKLENNGIESTTTYFLQEKIATEKLNFNVHTWGQRYFTTEHVVNKINDLTEINFEKTHLVIHVGLNDYVERMFLEEERLAMDLYPIELKNKILKFAQTYRKEIINRQLGHSYVPIKKFKKHIQSIIISAKQKNVKSLTFINIIALPQKSWDSTPRCMWNTSQFNMFLYDMEQQHDIQVIDLDRLIWEAGLHEHLLSDKMHLSVSGHKLLADTILKKIQG